MCEIKGGSNYGLSRMKFLKLNYEKTIRYEFHNMAKKAMGG